LDAYLSSEEEEQGPLPPASVDSFLSETMVRMSESAEEKVSGSDTDVMRDERDVKLLEGIMLLASALTELCMRLHEHSERDRWESLARSGVVEKTIGSPCFCHHVYYKMGTDFGVLL
jgi:hypothetical protein